MEWDILSFPCTRMVRLLGRAKLEMRRQNRLERSRRCVRSAEGVRRPAGGENLPGESQNCVRRGFPVVLKNGTPHASAIRGEESWI